MHNTQANYTINNVIFTLDDMQRLASFYDSGIAFDALSDDDEELVKAKFSMYASEVERSICNAYDNNDDINAHDKALNELYDFIHNNTNTFSKVNKADEQNVEQALYDNNFLVN